MIEQKIEKIAVDKFTTELDGLNVKVMGIWQVADDKGTEDNCAAVLAVKAYPRSYETPTIPDASI